MIKVSTSLVLLAAAAWSAPVAAQSISPAVVQTIIEAAGPSDLADRICAAPEDSTELLRASAALGGVRAYGDLVVLARSTCPAQASEIAAAAARGAPGRAGEVLFAIAAAERPLTAAQAVTGRDEVIVTIAAALRKGLVGLDPDGANGFDVIRVAYVLGGAMTAEAVAQQFGYEGVDLRQVVLAAMDISNNSDQPDLRSASYFEQFDNLPINVTRVFSERGSIIDVTSPSEGERPSPN